jgi:hypothetical protein
VTIGVLHPGEMGATVGAVLRARGETVLWASAGRSAATKTRAEEARLEDAGAVEELARRCDVIISLCPPHVATEVARPLASFDGIYVPCWSDVPTLTRLVHPPRAYRVDTARHARCDRRRHQARVKLKPPGPTSIRRPDRRSTEDGSPAHLDRVLESYLGQGLCRDEVRLLHDQSRVTFMGSARNLLPGSHRGGAAVALSGLRPRVGLLERDHIEYSLRPNRAAATRPLALPRDHAASFSLDGEQVARDLRAPAREHGLLLLVERRHLAVQERREERLHLILARPKPMVVALVAED